MVKGSIFKINWRKILKFKSLTIQNKEKLNQMIKKSAKKEDDEYV